MLPLGDKYVLTLWLMLLGGACIVESTGISFCIQQVSYNDRPEKAYEVFVNALASRYLDHGLVIPTLLDVHNPAGKLLLNV